MSLLSCFEQLDPALQVLLKKGSTVKGKQILSFSKKEQNNFDQVVPLKSVSISLNWSMTMVSLCNNTIFIHTFSKLWLLLEK